MRFYKKIPPGRLRSIKPTLADRWVPCLRIHAPSSNLRGRTHDGEVCNRPANTGFPLND